VSEESKKEKDCPILKGKLVDVWEWTNGVVISIQTENSAEKRQRISQNHRMKNIRVEEEK
jgi:hypothetical protein